MKIFASPPWDGRLCINIIFAYYALVNLQTRGVQYVHWVMHKCIMVKVGGKIHTKYVKSW